MKQYETPEMEVTRFAEADVIASGNAEPEITVELGDGDLIENTEV